MVQEHSTKTSHNLKTWEEVARKYRNSLRTYTAAYGRLKLSDTRVEDIIHDAMLRCIDKCPSLETIQDPRVYLLKFCFYGAKAYLAKMLRRRRLREQHSDAIIVRTVGNVDKTLEFDRTYEEIESKIRWIIASDVYRRKHVDDYLEVFKLASEGYTQKEIADITGKCQQNVGRRLRRIKEILSEITNRN